MTGIELVAFISANLIAIALLGAVLALVTRPGTRTRRAIDQQLGQLRAVLRPMPAGTLEERELQAAIEDDHVPLATVVQLAERAAEQQVAQPLPGSDSWTSHQG
ncbi:MAG: hypothetical protein J2P23_13880 [Microlunatus sp.]|nr:hypothetical protein [Microlunatus sp.]